MAEWEDVKTPGDEPENESDDKREKADLGDVVLPPQINDTKPPPPPKDDWQIDIEQPEENPPVIGDYVIDTPQISDSKPHPPPPKIELADIDFDRIDISLPSGDYGFGYKISDSKRPPPKIDWVGIDIDRININVPFVNDINSKKRG